MILPHTIEAQAKISYGLAYAPTFAQIDDLGNQSQKHRYGQQSILYAKWRSGKRFSYIAGLGYSFIQTEYSNIVPYTHEIFTTWFRHHDILLPFKLQYSFSTKPSRLIFVGGIIPSINVNRNVQVTSYYSYSTPSFARNVTNEQGYRWLDAFITLGIGYEYKIKQGGRIYIEPNFSTNFFTELLYIPKYLFYKQKDTYPPEVSTVGIEVGYFLK